MKCSFCSAETSKPLIIGPVRLGLIYCSRKCYVQDYMKKYPGTGLSDTLERMYPEYCEKQSMK